MRFRLSVTTLLVVTLMLSLIGPAVAQPAPRGGGRGGGPPSSTPGAGPPGGATFPLTQYGPNTATDNAVLRWNEELLIAVRQTKQAPPRVARILAIAHTAMYDAWAICNGGGAKPTKSTSDTCTNTTANKQAAVSHAAHEALSSLFGSRTHFDDLLAEIGNPAGTQNAAAVGRAAAQRVVADRASDPSGAGSYTESSDPFRWHALPGQVPLLPNWGNVRPFALPSTWRSSSTFMPPGPNTRNGNAFYRQQAEEIIQMSFLLNDTGKASAIYWADGPGSETPPGHWNVIAQAMSRKRGHSLDRDVKMFFALGNALLDASIIAWACKYRDDFGRPTTIIRHIYQGQMVRSWRGVVPAEQWESYIPTPPFPEYTSGHSSFSGAGAAVLRAATGSDSFGGSAVIPKGSSPTEPGVAPSRNVTLSWSTFTAAAADAGKSRLHGGIHFIDADQHGRSTGGAAGQASWNKAKSFFGTF